MHSAEMRRVLEDLDVTALRRLWAHLAPHLPQPKDDAQALVAAHHARTQAQSLPLKLRAWSHRWLIERGYPSALPDGLRPAAERTYPRQVEGVGISVNSKSAIMQPIVPLVRAAMEDAVCEAFADNKREPSFVRRRMMEARERVVRTLIGKGCLP